MHATLMKIMHNESNNPRSSTSTASFQFLCIGSYCTIAQLYVTGFAKTLHSRTSNSLTLT